MKRTRYYTADDVRTALSVVLASMTQADLARETGLKPQHISVMAKGAPITGKLLAWLGFERVDGLYSRTASSTRKGA